VHDGVDGLVVEPDGPSIAKAIDRICGDVELREVLSRGALATASTYTWRRAADQLRSGLDRLFD
jgi:glycosyltransferase involved in cell wall biosynthesis